MTMKAQIAGGARASAYATAARARPRAHAPPTTRRASAPQARADLLTPVAKAWSTDIGVEVASIGVQVHGGMGFIEETGAAQHYRDARILPIYEGTNGIQAIDLVTRKLPLEGGATVRNFIADLASTVGELRASNHPEFGRMGERLDAAVMALAEATDWIGANIASNPDAALASAAPYLRLFGIATGGIYLARGALAAAQEPGHPNAIAYARFFAENIAVSAPGLAAAITSGADAILDVEPRALAG